MADTTFVDNSTVIAASWLNDVNDRVYTDVINVKSAPYNALGDGATNDTAALQAAIDAAITITDREKALVFPPGDYRVTTLDMDSLRQCHIICEGAVFITGTSNVATSIVTMSSIEADPCTAITISGTLAIQAAGSTSYQHGFYGRWITNSELRMSISGAFSVASLDIDSCHNNNFKWIYATNTTSGKHCIKCGQNNVNINKWHIRCAGTGSGNTQIGMELGGSGNVVFGDVSNLGTGLKMTAARGSTITLYTEANLTSITTSGVNRGNTVLGGYYEVLDGTIGLDFSGGTMQGLSIIGPRIKSASGTTTGIAFGTGSYGVNLMSPDYESITTEWTGTLRGGSGGVNEQLIGGTRHRTTGVVSFLGGWTDTLQTVTISGAGTTTIDASLGNEMIATVSTGAGFTMGAPTNPTTGQLLTITFKNTSGGAMGTITWNAVFKMATFTTPATAFNRSITFRYDGTNWVERYKTAADVAN